MRKRSLKIAKKGKTGKLLPTVAAILAFNYLLCASGSRVLADQGGEWSPDRPQAAVAVTAGLWITEVSCPYDTLAINQKNIPVTVRVKNLSDSEISIQLLSLIFTYVSSGDHNSDYTVTGSPSADSLLSPDMTGTFEFDIDVNPDAITDVNISVKAVVVGEKQDNLQIISARSDDIIYALDSFSIVALDNNDGTYNWRAEWTEIGESDGPGIGKIQVVESPGNLRIGDPASYSPVGVSRAIKLGDAGRALLEFSWARDPAYGFNGTLVVEISENGTDGWETIFTVGSGPGTSFATQIFDMSDYISDDTAIRLMTSGTCSGIVYFDDIKVTPETLTGAFDWTVLSDVIFFTAALFDTKNSRVRADDGLLFVSDEEGVILNNIHYLNGGRPLISIPFEQETLYRLVIQFNSTFDWDWEPKESEEGYVAFNDSSLGFGRISAPRPGLKELLLSELMIGDEEADPADYLIGATKSDDPVIPWTMKTDPLLDPKVDDGKVKEYGALVEGLDPPRMIIDCRDDDKHWEITGNCESDRYYFHEVWFKPDLEWAHGDTADIFLHLGGKEPDENLDELHLLLRMIDDDYAGPVISDFSPEVLPAGAVDYITCLITDPSGVYDDESGAGGQGVYLLWDTDGSLEDDYNEMLMSPAGGGYFTSDGMVGGVAEGTDLVYRVFACDDDSDRGAPDRSCSVSSIQHIQILGSAIVFDNPSTLTPDFVYPGDEDQVFSIKVSNPNPENIVILPAVSYLQIDDGDSIITTYLANETLLVPGATQFPISFDPVDIPEDFSAPDSLELTLHLEGTFMGFIFWEQTWTASITNRLIVREPLLLIEAHSIASVDVNPGDRKIELMRLEISLDGIGDISIDSLVVLNPIGSEAERSGSDSNFERLYLYKEADVPETTGQIEEDAGEPLPASRPLGEGDSLLAEAVFENRRAVFDLSSGKVIHPGESVYYYIAADVDSFSARDGEYLDVEIDSPDSIHISGNASIFIDDLPLNSEGSCRIDGFLSFQARVVNVLPDTVYSGGSGELVLAVDLPGNGNSPDILSGLSAWNFGDYEANGLVEELILWADNGNGVFSSETDGSLGILSNTGGRFQISGLSQPIFGSKRFFLTAVFGQGFTENLLVRFGIPENGVEYISGNDGPLDSELINTHSQILIRREGVTIESFQSADRPDVLYPGDRNAEIFGMRVRNNTIGQAIIDSLSLASEMRLFECEPLKPVFLFLDDGDDTFDPEKDTILSETAWSEGEGFFGEIGIDIASGAEAVLYLATDIDSFRTADGETLSVWLDNVEDIYLSIETENPYEISGDFPLMVEEAPSTDGMLSFQIRLSAGDSTISGRTENIPVLDLVIPGNGCHDDTLTSITVVNDGTAGKEHIKRTVLWKDDGDGIFDPDSDEFLSELDQIETKKYNSSGLAVTLTGGSGERLFVSVDLEDAFTTGASIMAGIPRMGIGVASGNDGPSDKDIFSDKSILIPVPDRVTLYTSMLGNRRVHPGENDLLIMVIGAYNSYALPKTLQSIQLLRSGSARPEEILRAKAYSDADEDGFFDPASDRLLQTVESSGVLFEFDALLMTLAPYKSSQIFIAYDIPGEGVRDSVAVDFSIPDRTWVSFISGTTVIEGEFPLNSAGEDLIDGMVASQIEVATVNSARVSPGDMDVPCFSFRLPCNGTQGDSLISIVLENEGSGMPGIDIEYLKLWKEGGGEDGIYDPGEEEFIGYFMWNGSSWNTVSSLWEYIDCDGLSLHVTADFSEIAVDGRTVVLSLPVDAIEVRSGNDGPIDRPLISKAKITVTTDPIIVSFVPILPVTTGQVFDCELILSNVTDSLLTMVRPDSFMHFGDGGIAPLSGPFPESIDLEAHHDSSFTWSFNAVSQGKIVFQAKASEDGGIAQSRLEYSDTISIENIPDDFDIMIDDLSPVSLNRGHRAAEVFEMAVSYSSGCEQCAAVDFVSIELIFTDGAGTGLAVNDVASKITFEDETMVLFSAQTSSVTDSTIELTPVEPVIFSPGDMKIFTVSLDVAEDARAANFRLLLEDPDDISIIDHNNSALVIFGGSTFPWSTNTITLKDPAVELLVGVDTQLPEKVNRGQETVPAFSLVIANSGGSSAADISVSAIEFKTFDMSNEPLAPSGFLKKIRIQDMYGYSYFVTDVFPLSSGIHCLFQPELVVSALTPLVLNAFLDFRSDPEPSAFAISLHDSISVSARDINSGQTVEVRANASEGYGFPMNCGEAIFIDPLSSFSISGDGLLPTRITGGLDDVDALRLTLCHTGTTGESPAAVSGLSLRLIDQTGGGLAQNSKFSAIRVESIDSVICAVYPTALDTSSYIRMEFDDPVLIEPEGSVVLDISLDIDQDAVPGYFQMHLYGTAVEILDATSGAVFDKPTGAFPLSSGLTNVVIPVGSISFEASGVLPANIAAGEKVKAFDLRFSRSADSGGSTAMIDFITLHFEDEKKMPVETASDIAGITIESGSGMIETEAVQIEDGVRVDFIDPQRLESEETLDLELFLTIAPGTAITMVSAAIRSADDISGTDETTGDPVAVGLADGSAFPFNSGRAALLSTELEDSFSNYPNPFVASREKTTIVFFMPDNGTVTVQVYTILGRLVRTLALNEERGAGPHQDISWDGRNGRGEKVINGVYYLVLKAKINGKEQVLRRKAALVR
ncbi:MAG: hypothetical protein JW814_06450 [Candidatus Krumholzibacteriota bacterium]|nr:hypothetical protein [Candidatus Krumholzibacteriota bacterium]